MKGWRGAGLAGVAIIGWASVAHAQSLSAPKAAPSLSIASSVVAAAPGPATAPTYVPDSASPFGDVKVSNDDAAQVTMPDLVYKSDGTEAANFDKYFYFHRADTDFATAYADLIECDGYARGLQSGVPATYGQGIIGDAVANALADAIYGSANKRRVRRTNMRICMNFKGYDRFGITKDLWEKFNFEEGLHTVPNDQRDAALRQQALVASSGTPQGKALGL